MHVKRFWHQAKFHTIMAMFYGIFLAFLNIFGYISALLGPIFFKFGTVVPYCAFVVSELRFWHRAKIDTFLAILDILTYFWLYLCTPLTNFLYFWHNGALVY